MNLPALLANAQSLVGKITVRSAVNPALWLAGVISVLTFTLAFFSEGPAFWAFFIVGLLPLLLFGVSYLWFVFKKPDYLRSEECHLKLESLRMLGDKDNPSAGNAEHIVAVTSPALPAPNPQTHE